MVIIPIPSTAVDKGFMKDGGKRIWITTNELSKEQKDYISYIADDKHFINLYMVPEKQNITVGDFEVPESPTEFKEDKSPSQRLRNTIYVYWKQKDMKEEFDLFYNRQIGIIINKFKSYLT